MQTIGIGQAELSGIDIDAIIKEAASTNASLDGTTGPKGNESQYNRSSGNGSENKESHSIELMTTPPELSDKDYYQENGKVSLRSKDV